MLSMLLCRVVNIDVQSYVDGALTSLNSITHVDVVKMAASAKGVASRVESGLGALEKKAHLDLTPLTDMAKDKATEAAQDKVHVFGPPINQPVCSGKN